MPECNWDESKETEGSESENGKLAGAHDVDCISYAECVIHRGFVLEKNGL
jgi:hypothetical protein